MSSSNLDLKNINYQDPLRSKPVRENFTDIENNFNALRTEVYASIASTASEITSARDGYTNLSDNIQARRINGNGVYSGGNVTAQGTPDNTVHINTGAGICPNGVGVEWSGANSNTISAVTKPRYIVAVINSDDTLSLELGATGDDPFLPDLSVTQQPLGIIYQGTASPVVINNSDISDAKEQGARYNNNYYFKIQDAVDVANDTLGGVIEVGAGNYYEEIDLIGKSNLTLDFDNDSIVYRPDDTTYAIKSLNTVGNEANGIKIKGANLYGNSKTGNKELLKFEYTDNFIIENCSFDGNTTSTATYQNVYINNCNDFYYKNNVSFDGSGNIDNNRVCLISETFDNSLLFDEYEKKWYQKGNDLNISSVLVPSITALTSSRIAYIDRGNSDLRVYDFDGTNWTQTGNDLNITGITGNVTITALTSSRIAFIDSNNADLRTYDFDGTNWSQAGNDLNISGAGLTYITALTSSRVAYIDLGNDDLRVYDFDGTDWSQTGNDLNLAGLVAQVSISALSSSRIAFVDGTNDDLRVYDFDGTDWTQTGNDLNITGITSPSITSLSYKKIALIDLGLGSLRTYGFDGTNWNKIDNDFSITLTTPAYITSLTDNRIAFIDDTNDDLRAYDLRNIIKGGIAPPSPAF